MVENKKAAIRMDPGEIWVLVLLAFFDLRLYSFPFYFFICFYVFLFFIFLICFLFRYLFFVSFFFLSSIFCFTYSIYRILFSLSYSLFSLEKKLKKSRKTTRPAIKKKTKNWPARFQKEHNLTKEDVLDEKTESIFHIVILELVDPNPQLHQILKPVKLLFCTDSFCLMYKPALIHSFVRT